jgi:NADH-quinone oxidoreductase subunit N
MPLAVDWQQMLTVLAVMSLAIGNITALVQTNIKRMLAYSTISQMGFMLLGLLSGIGGKAVPVEAYGAAMFYSIAYVLTTLGTFGMIMLLARAGFEAENLDDFKGLNQRSPWLALLMLILMFSLAGVPPTVGFYAKLAVLQAVVNTGQVWLAVAAVLFSLIGAFYYLRIVKLMYFDNPTDRSPITASGDMRFAISINGLAILVLGILPGSLMAACNNAIGQSLGHTLKTVAKLAS